MVGAVECVEEEEDVTYRARTGVYSKRGYGSCPRLREAISEKKEVSDIEEGTVGEITVEVDVEEEEEEENAL